jgi:glycerate-2-kinase
MKRRLRIQKGQSRKKTLVEERIEMLEAAVYKDYDSTKPIGGASNIVEVTNKGIALENETEVNREKLRGKFIVHINKKLPLTSKI